jgi:hypothetical protein
VTAPNVAVAMPAKAAVAVMRSRRTSGSLSDTPTIVVSRCVRNRTFFACRIFYELVASEPIFEIALARPASLRK